MKKGQILRGRRWVMCGELGLLVAASVGTVQAQPADARQLFAIPAQALPQALNLLSQQIHVSLLIAQACRQGQSQTVQGTFTANEALNRLLAGSGCTYEYSDSHTLIIKPLSKTSRKQQPAGINQKPASEPKASAPKVQQLQQVSVTGTRIRGGTTPSPTITITAQQIQNEGFNDLGEVIRSIPQNFNGGQNPGVTTGASIGNAANSNLSGGSALNLRGLGPDATLTLLNGRRLAYDGTYQAVDINAIPVEAVERLEIVPDGASAIYGSDAVGGVANVILKRDFEGVTLGARYGGATDGGMATREYTATAGTTWSSGGLIATWKKSSSNSILADQRDYTSDMYDPTTLYPKLVSKSGLLSLHQSFGDVAELHLDALNTLRRSESYAGYSSYYNQYPRKTSISLVSPSIEFTLPHDWSLTLGGTYGKDETLLHDYRVTPTASALTDNRCYCNESHSYELGAEGPIFSVGDGDARLAVGIGSRKSEFENFSYLSATGYGGDESNRFAYAELNLPLVLPNSSINGIRRLEFSTAVRSEDYDSYGRVTTPKLGLIYDPSADFTIKASWGRSFKAPELFQRYYTPVAYLYGASVAGGSGYASDATVLISFGGNPDLKPERARTSTASLAFHPESLPALETELTWFDIDYTDRVVLPINAVSRALSDPINAEFVTYAPTAEEQALLLATYSIQNFAGASYDPSKVVAIVSGQYINAARLRVEGLDMSGSYRFEFGNSSTTVRGSISRLNSSQQNSASQSFHDLAGAIFQPAKFKGRIGAVWTRNGFSASGFVNYTSGVTSKLATTTEKTASFTTVDASLRYDTGVRGGTFSGFVFELSAQNLFNRKPPFYTSNSILYPPYDSTNYSAIGRYLNLSVSKHW